MLKNTHFIQHFAVEGFGEFPMDMLRYDNAWPRSESDAHAIQSGPNYEGRYRVNLARAACNHLGPTARRWQSFCWRVVEVDGVADPEYVALAVRAL